MPQDVPMGQGYMGDALLAAFPGQYRDESPRSNPVTYLPQPPGAAAGTPTYTDPDSGRQLKLITMPGVGQVVVPVEHTMIGVNGPVTPVDYTMVGCDAIACSVDRENLSGLGHAQVCSWGIGKISKAAGAAASEALALIKQGKIKTAGEAQAHIKASTAKVGSHVVSRLQARIPKVPVVVDQAAAQAWAAVRGQAEQMLSGGSMGHAPQEDLSGMGLMWKKRVTSWVDGLAAAAREGAQAALQLAQSGPISGMAVKVGASPAVALLTKYVSQKMNAYVAATVHRGEPPAAVFKQVLADTVKAWTPKVSAALQRSKYIIPSPTGPVPSPSLPPVAAPGSVRRVL